MRRRRSATIGVLECEACGELALVIGGRRFTVKKCDGAWKDKGSVTIDGAGATHLRKQLRGLTK